MAISIKRESIIAFELELVMDWETKVLWFCYFLDESENGIFTLGVVAHA